MKILLEVHLPPPLAERGAHYGPGELFHNFSISNDLAQVVNFPNQIPDCDSHSPALVDLLFLLTLVFALQWLSLYLEILIMLLSQLPLALRHVHNGIPYFITQLMTIFGQIGMAFLII